MSLILPVQCLILGMFLFNHQSPAETNEQTDCDFEHDAHAETKKQEEVSQSAAANVPGLLLIWPDNDGRVMLQHSGSLEYIDGK